jgi:hypothetical protein
VGVDVKVNPHFFWTFFEKGLDNNKNNQYIINIMKRNKITYDFNGGWTAGEANRQIGMKNTQKVIRSKKEYTRKEKYKSNLFR